MAISGLGGVTGSLPLACGGPPGLGHDVTAEGRLTGRIVPTCQRVGETVSETVATCTLGPASRNRYGDQPKCWYTVQYIWTVVQLFGSVLQRIGYYMKK